jgi:hypothetical protein
MTAKRSGKKHENVHRKSKPHVSDRVAVLTLRLSGPGLRKGTIPVPELIRVCEEAQNAVTRQAEALEGKKTIHPGPTSVGIREECTLELISLGDGSTTLGFDFAKPQMALPIPGQRSLGTEAISEISETILSLGNGDKKKDHDAGVLRSIYGISSLIDKKITKLTWESQKSLASPIPGAAKVIKAKINSTVRERAAAHLSKPTFKTVQIDGVLDMADFGRKDRKFRVDPAIGQPVLCLFAVEFEEAVQANIRQPVRVRGLAKIQADSARIEHIQVTSLESLSSLALGEGNFLKSQTIQELADAQGVEAFERDKAVEWFASEEEIESFVADIYKARKPL